jgi:hypothetical protein
MTKLNVIVVRYKRHQCRFHYKSYRDEKHNLLKLLHTLTICAAAASTGIPRQQSRAVSADKASQTPSLDITSLPPAVDNCRNMI